MDAKTFSFHGFYLRWAGLASLALSLFASFLLILTFREENPEIKAYLGIAGAIGILLGYAIGRDITDRIRNHEESAKDITNLQVRLAWMGSQFGRLPWLLFGLSVLIWSMLLLINPEERWPRHFM